MSFKLPATVDARKEAKAMLKNRSESSDRLASPTPSAPSQKRQRVDVDLEEGIKTLKISESANIFVDPSSIEDHVNDLATEDEEKFLRDLGVTKISDDVVANSYRVLLESLALRKSVKYYLDRIKGIKKSLSEVQKDKESMAEEIKVLKEKVDKADKLELELGKEKETVQALTKELTTISTRCYVKARGEAMLEFQRGRTDQWEVQEDIDLYNAHFPKDYSDMVKRLDMEDLAKNQDAHSRSVDHEAHSTDRIMD